MIRSLSDFLGCGAHNQFSEVSLIDRLLPSEIFQKILSFMDEIHMESTAAVSQYWNAQTIDLAKHNLYTQRNQILTYKDFCSFLCNNLNPELYESQIKEFLLIGSEDFLFNSINLIELKTSPDRLREKILNILKTVKEEDLKQLRALSKKTEIQSWDNLFDFVEIYKKIDKAYELPHFQQELKLYEICGELVRMGNIYKSIEVAEAITSRVFKSGALCTICTALLDSGHIGKAIKVSNLVPEEQSDPFPEINSVRRRICRMLAGRGNGEDINKAIGMTLKISDAVNKNAALAEISVALRNRGEDKRALEVEGLIPVLVRIRILEDISRCCEGDPDYARELGIL